MDKKDLIKEFNQELSSNIELMKDQANYDPKHLRKMAAETDHYQAAKNLINKPTNTSGFIKLYEAKRTDLTIEHLVIQPKYQTLFTEEEIKLCRRRLS